jgi:hypothetical protein
VVLTSKNVLQVSRIVQTRNQKLEEAVLVSGFWFLVSGFWFLVSGFWFLVSGFWFLVSGLYNTTV